MDEKQFKELIGRMDMIAKALLLNLLKDLKTQQEKILTLSSFGIKPKDIAAMLGTSDNTVNVTLSNVRKKAKLADQKERPSTASPDAHETTVQMQSASRGE